MAFTDEEKVAIRRHLGYGNVGSAETFVLGIPAAIETAFVIEGAMNKVLPAAESEVRRHIAILNKIEGQLIDDLELLAVDRVDEIVIRGTEMRELRKEYQFWRDALANMLSIYPNAWDQRFANSGINVGVKH